MLLRQHEARRDPVVAAEELMKKHRAITFLAAMQQHDVIRQAARAIEKFVDGDEGLRIGKVSVSSGDAALQEPRAAAIGLL